MTTDAFDALEELDPYYLDRDARSPLGRVWSLDKAVVVLGAAGIFQIFKGSGTDPTGLTNYGIGKLWLRNDGGITDAPAEVRIYAGSGSASLLASWPLLSAEGVAGLRRYLDTYSAAEIDAIIGGGVAMSSDTVSNLSNVAGAVVSDALDALLTAVNAKVATALLGVNNGVATLGVDGILTEAQRPAITMDLAGLEAAAAIDVDTDQIPIYDASATSNKYITIQALLEGLNLLAEDAAPDMAADFLLAYDTSAATVKKVKPQYIGAGRKSIWLGAGSFRAVTTGAKVAALATTSIDSGANDLTFPVLTFSATVDNYAWTTIMMPDSWDRQAIRFKAVYLNAATGTGDVVWGLAARACSTGEVLDGSPTEQTVTTSASATAALTNITTAESSDLTIAGSPAEGDLCILQIRRPAASNVADTFTQATYLVGVAVYYTDSVNTDN